VTCKRKDSKRYYYATFDEASAIIIKAIKNNDKKFLLEHAPCEIYTSDLEIRTLEYIIPAIEQIIISDIDLQSYKKNENNILFHSTTTSDCYLFHFKKSRYGWFWSEFQIISCSIVES